MILDMVRNKMRAAVLSVVCRDAASGSCSQSAISNSTVLDPASSKKHTGETSNNPLPQPFKCMEKGMHLQPFRTCVAVLADWVYILVWYSHHGGPEDADGGVELV